jgi:phage terminase large subunit
MTLTKSERAQLKKAYEGLSTPKFFKRVLGVKYLAGYQDKTLQVFDDNERTAVKACHNVGKTFKVSRYAIKFLVTHEDSVVISTAPTFNQVKNILWAELRQAHARSKIPLGGKLNTTEWRLAEKWFALGFSPKADAGSIAEGESTASTFQGFHAKHILIIFDEATGIPDNVWDMAEGLLTSGNVKFIAIGNPTSKRSRFYKLFSDREWAKVTITCFDSPNLIANGITDKAALRRHVEKYKKQSDENARRYLKAYQVPHPEFLTASWVVAKIAKWGFEHPLSLSKVFGEFPETSPDALLSLGDVERAQQRVYVPTATDRKVLGLDPARFGNDDSVFTGLHGKQQVDYERFSKYDEVEIAGQAIKKINAFMYDVVIVDETGIGGGVVTILRHAQRAARDPSSPHYAPMSGIARVEIRGVVFGESKSLSVVEDKKRGMSPADEFTNQKARMFGYLETDIKAEDGLCLLNETVYQEELPLIKKRYDEKAGKLVIQSKDEFKKSFAGVSPDAADSLALANLGRYDELSAVGTFSKSHIQTHTSTKTETRRPLAGGLRSRKEY